MISVCNTCKHFIYQETGKTFFSIIESILSLIGFTHFSLFSFLSRFWRQGRSPDETSAQFVGPNPLTSHTFAPIARSTSRPSSTSSTTNTSNLWQRNVNEFFPVTKNRFNCCKTSGNIQNLTYLILEQSLLPGNV